MIMRTKKEFEKFYNCIAIIDADKLIQYYTIHNKSIRQIGPYGYGKLLTEDNIPYIERYVIENRIYPALILNNGNKLQSVFFKNLRKKIFNMK